MEQAEKLWTKSYIMLILGNLFTFMSFQMLIPTLPPYIKSIGGSVLEVGLITALFSLGAIFIRPFIGFLLAFKARKMLVLIGAAALLLITLFYPLTNVIVILLAFRLIHGIAWGWSTTANGTAAVDLIPNSRLGEGTGYYGLSITLGMIIAPSLGLILYERASFDTLVYVSAFLGVIALVLLSFVSYQMPADVKKAKREEMQFSYVHTLIEKACWFPALLTLLVAFGYGSIVSFIVIFSNERGIENIFLFYLVNAVFATLSRPITGKMFDRSGPRKIVIFCSLLTFASLWVLSFSYSSLHVAIAGMLLGIGYGSILPVLQSWSLSITEPSRRGIANAMSFSAIDLGIGLSGIIFGVLAAYFEISSIFQISSFFILLVTVLVLFSPKAQHVKKKQQRAS
ncbi:MFS transporter [Bacillus sp. AGMB 02131]|uniref:MFS transporter n=1 Tax=Peribacillus faecalis TaxID=2772559 RepID=A0A927HCG0_9BACI|nr:MFS transporter [Peribacillus faecalis]MBD3109582.1 MFS transporter [Peribacillus faecalis]